MPTTPHSPTRLPARVDSAVLAKFRLPGEPLIIVKLVGVGNNAPYDFHDKGTRSFIFRFESALEGHVLRVPLHLWQENDARLAHDLLDQRRFPHAIIVFLELPPVAQPPQTNSSQMGATDTRTETRIVVGPGTEPTVAPTFPPQATPDTTSDKPNTQDEGRPACPQAAAAVAPDSQTTPADLTAQREASVACPQCEGSAVSPQTATAEAPTLQAAAPAPTADRPLHEAAYDQVAAPKRLKALAALLSVPEPALRAAIAHPASQIELATAGWVRRKVWASSKIPLSTIYFYSAKHPVSPPPISNSQFSVPSFQYSPRPQTTSHKRHRRTENNSPPPTSIRH